MGERRNAAEDYRYEFERYVGKRRAGCIEANACDHKGTSEAELDRLDRELAEHFAKGCALLDSMTAAEAGKCRRYAAIRTGSEYGIDDFSVFLVKDRAATGFPEWQGPPKAFHVGPKWLEWIDEYEKIRDIVLAA